MTMLNETHDPARTSWVESANVPGADFPIQNLPFCVFSADHAGSRIGVAIGDLVLDLTTASAMGLLPADVKDAFDASRPALLNSLMDKDPKVLSALRLATTRSRSTPTSFSISRMTSVSTCRLRSAASPTSSRRSTMWNGWGR
jgi:fumarylacetoacetase